MLRWGSTLGLSWAIALLLVAGAAMAQSPQAPTTEAPAASASGKTPAVATEISYVNGQLRIHALDSTLAAVLEKVAALVGVTIEIPPDAGTERMPLVELGPGPPRQILASLLSDSSLDYLIQASDTDPAKIRRVLLLPRGKESNSANAKDAAARRLRSPYARAAFSEPAPAPDTPVSAQPDNAAAEAMPVNPQPASTLAEPALQPSRTQPQQSTGMRPGALTPPATLSPQSISQQLQQMYQQRIQMMQQDRANPGSK